MELLPVAFHVVRQAVLGVELQERNTRKDKCMGQEVRYVNAGGKHSMQDSTAERMDGEGPCAGREVE